MLWEPWVEIRVIGKLLDLQVDSRRVLVLPQFLLIQQAVQAFLLHRCWLRQALLVFARSMWKSSRLPPDLAQHMCQESLYVKQN